MMRNGEGFCHVCGATVGTDCFTPYPACHPLAGAAHPARWSTPKPCTHGVGGDPVNGCDEHAGWDGLCDSHRAAYMATVDLPTQAWCECGDGCELVFVDCCAREIPACETARDLDSNGDVNAVTCRADSGCEVLRADRWGEAAAAYLAGDIQL